MAACLFFERYRIKTLTGISETELFSMLIILRFSEQLKHQQHWYSDYTVVFYSADKRFACYPMTSFCRPG